MRFSLKAVTLLGLFAAQICTAAVPQCVFRKTIAFGASVTQATAYMIPGYRAVVRGVELYGSHFGDTTLPQDLSSPLRTYTPRPFGLSPVRYLVKQLADKKALDRITYIGSYVTQTGEDLGSSQMLSMMQGERQELFNSASLIVGVDAFYWDSIWQNCGYGSGAGAEPIIAAFIQEAKKRGITLILGNVPNENSANVRIDSHRTGVPGFWYPPKPQCSDSINATLNRFCTPQNGCYIADLKSLAEDVNCGQKVALSDGSSYSLFELRPDGVHLSDKGSRYLAELMAKVLERNPPTCGK
jgi:hypothetical protein